MTPYVGASIQFQTHSVTDLLPDTSRRYRGLRKKRSTGIRLGLETQDAPDPGPPGIGQKPAHDVRDRSNVPLGDGAVVRELQWRADTLTDVSRQVRECLAHGVKIPFGLDASDGITMATGLRHVDVDRDLAEPSADHESFEKFGMLEFVRGS